MRVVYVAGKFTGKNSWEIHRNVCRAEVLGLAVAETGAMPLIPHKNTSNFHGTVTDEFWYEGTLELLKRCDAMILVPGWEDSKGVKAEMNWARANNMPVFERVDELKGWLQAKETNMGEADKTDIVRRIDLKHHINSKGEIVKTTNGTIIDPSEPTILFRGRDHLAVPLLLKYREMCAADGCNDYQLSSVDELIRRFAQFAEEHPDVMKQPGVTRGL